MVAHGLRGTNAAGFRGLYARRWCRSALHHLPLKPEAKASRVGAAPQMDRRVRVPGSIPEGEAIRTWILFGPSETSDL